MTMPSSGREARPTRGSQWRWLPFMSWLCCQPPGALRRNETAALNAGLTGPINPKL
ncbi:hypothetical protein FHR94_001725 [Halomonas cerina]|uniref:Uncharacterized protein n=1 Tax=Halomonas cerina TaxID=447424 RepID=A0A839V523_9GAMM|nr:hypothetical protein [Halomonas cerina]